MSNNRGMRITQPTIPTTNVFFSISSIPENNSLHVIPKQPLLRPTI
jgi:hypothetical protein